MWQRIQHALANKYLIVGMGDVHRVNLQPRLQRAGIRHEEVESALVQQRSDINAHWVPRWRGAQNRIVARRPSCSHKRAGRKRNAITAAREIAVRSRFGFTKTRRFGRLISSCS